MRPSRSPRGDGRSDDSNSDDTAGTPNLGQATLASLNCPRIGTFVDFPGLRRFGAHRVRDNMTVGLRSGLAVAATCILASCTGWQSSLNAQAPQSEDIRHLLLIFITVAAVVWIGVM